MTGNDIQVGDVYVYRGIDCLRTVLKIHSTTALIRWDGVLDTIDAEENLETLRRYVLEDRWQKVR
jgi:hypothetical protein